VSRSPDRHIFEFSLFDDIRFKIEFKANQQMVIQFLHNATNRWLEGELIKVIGAPVKVGLIG